MSTATGSYDANYSGYCQWQTDEQERYDQILDEMDTMSPFIALFTLMFFLGNYQQQQVAWTSVEINDISDAQNMVSELQAAFSAQAYGVDDSQSVRNGIDAGDELYGYADAIQQSGNTNNPFYSISNNVMSQLDVIYPDGWDYDNADPDYTGLENYWNSEWEAAATGTGCYLTATNTAFSSLNSSFSGQSAAAQSQIKAEEQNYQMYLGSMQDVEKSWIDQDRFSNQAMQSAGG